jgi:hypothetical protein
MVSTEGTRFQSEMTSLLASLDHRQSYMDVLLDTLFRTQKLQLDPNGRIGIVEAVSSLNEQGDETDQDQEWSKQSVFGLLDVCLFNKISRDFPRLTRISLLMNQSFGLRCFPLSPRRKYFKT